ncbi:MULTISPECIES: 2-oxoglutarate dehydrogenase complex dihydrolipoyllysine-residue succinyltransferase [Deinococcus]|jgi:2-oxoglutarate dehydrogenase E2 component (EC 2.3.1.61)|uniref:Dihydrolipoyllysine-residue succinyltransferase component of 2-oxoglutarate dehydrogenase complex n=1 Tax=Deinococcus radiodurans (strain ATCC 13939 / DSM 20539 / JCM 16871 / CCUG 27074 / LMG 4051 / NBRC 15346 / NCIMB 9279 / VKM B-1422 / R1) TaxID=243230 RepID=Q9RY67_DEIRA|nr:2-oxoglutarate dehydrogenase complex dihydrolipoyllysine-residue succinyltransferase [Deinococcus radiodurans]AAF09675.1 2-oxoglutarate dehydrogenase, dihydrolipoamide succinyltransferase E2 component [Deinococcus radiodurans R1 = ATCC 13939 = DSM 20539]ANC72626.1 dihydrolipoamide succinyltransferase [Deinococcus radiodurans R1 = ATCC 13939 = DSM 20539]QEM72059.1 2-oxoglutarate dehydrogenase complex dihydrolipoyllysine-residue succinyltransferase [Deinococcus radiodurans]QIP28331.1 2-oxoglut
MADIKVPVFSESVSEGTLLTWHKKPGEAVKRGELLAEIETDKVVLEVTAQQDGVLQSIAKNEGDTVLSEEVLGTMGEGDAAAPAPAAQDQASGPVASETTAGGTAQQPDSTGTQPAAQSGERREDLSPAVRKIVEEKGLDVSQVPATGPKNNITKADAMGASAPAPAAQPAPQAAKSAVVLPSGPRPEERVPMTRIRARIAERLKEVQNTAALLTTFNEVNMQPTMELRKKYQDQFVKKHGVKLGFMSLFVRAATEALKAFPMVNASVDGKDVIYHGYYDIGIAVASERGLVVPILRDTDNMSLADIEKQIAEFATRARAGKLTMEDMSGGTFSITNGGTFGSMMSTPIINAPQSAILGMHNIIERPIAQNGQVVIAPMMYLAVSYDHRLIDGKEAVQFLVMIKNLLEDPARMLLDL